MATLAPAEETVLSRLLPELVQLSAAARLEVVSRLVESVQADAATVAPKTLLSFVGAWKDDSDADAMEEAIQNSRHSEIKTHLEDWD